MKIKSFNITTKPKDAGIFIFLTSANNGKQALLNLINNSNDFKNLISKTDSNNMVIEIKHCKR